MSLLSTFFASTQKFRAELNNYFGVEVVCVLRGDVENNDAIYTTCLCPCSTRQSVDEMAGTFTITNDDPLNKYKQSTLRYIVDRFGERVDTSTFRMPETTMRHVGEDGGAEDRQHIRLLPILEEDKFEYFQYNEGQLVPAENVAGQSVTSVDINVVCFRPLVGTRPDDTRIRMTFKFTNPLADTACVIELFPRKLLSVYGISLKNAPLYFTVDKHATATFIAEFRCNHKLRVLYVERNTHILEAVVYKIVARDNIGGREVDESASRNNVLPERSAPGKCWIIMNSYHVILRESGNELSNARFTPLDNVPILWENTSDMDVAADHSGYFTNIRDDNNIDVVVSSSRLAHYQNIIEKKKKYMKMRYNPVAVHFDRIPLAYKVRKQTQDE